MARRDYERQWRAQLKAAIVVQSEQLEDSFRNSLSAQDLEDALTFEGTLAAPNGDMDFVDELVSELARSYSFRYISRPLMYARNNHSVIERLEGFNNRKCLAFMRMKSSSFLKLLRLVFNHNIFKSGGYKEQEEVAVQLAIVLDRLGHNGNGMAATRLAETWHKSEGSCTNYTNRVLIAILSLQERFLH
ncbi:hypothetical protein BC939DRAFT_468513 [Gamsiella multidivaricata]|uniref:uncharacterized protein n=1 Tax=Gamsiella multidivaricata TaxID=101098 RepID=UPI00221FE050|nr:uncharacterized protein BC939DRAFT_468513 [Gamsiella multidivaricata]KAI7816639.1 hypothetical protein BC939DRAFT_468513 [Gamsiella multidivaricata]